MRPYARQFNVHGLLRTIVRFDESALTWLGAPIHQGLEYPQLRSHQSNLTECTLRLLGVRVRAGRAPISSKPGRAYRFHRTAMTDYFLSLARKGQVRSRNWLRGRRLNSSGLSRYEEF